MCFEPSRGPVLAALIGVGMFAMLDAIMKEITGHYSVAQSTGMRYWAGALVAAVYYGAVQRQWPNRGAILRSLPRSLANLVAGTCFFTAISRLSLVDAVTLTFLSPFFMAFWGRVLLGEHIRPAMIIAMIIGLLGVVIIAYGQSMGGDHRFDPIGLGAAIGCAASYALSMAITRLHGPKDTLPTLVLLPGVIGALIASPFMMMSWQPVSLWHLELVALVGLIGTMGYICLAWAYTHSGISMLGVLDYTGLIWAGLFGYVIFHEIPPPSTIAGSVLIIGACLSVMLWRDGSS